LQYALNCVRRFTGVGVIEVDAVDRLYAL
jgi:hypothetical protein